ncbi:CDP-glucose 4,6-dehydratase [Prosthecomicrobium pneumaticum]|uniref:CDP-glucose 4,6-dehydratase n=1 Tax=Prosthecomicrobium pneumaticum TaxID=81895 RepID=A0A7W9FNN6_9HYPH|nr:CDP-glucose 4,6-dehydratase [Prosthecomicrobium pneumaticum]
MSGADAWRDRRVLVTGHTGFKGAWLILWLERLGARVTGFALPPATQPSLFDLVARGGTAESLTGDVRDLAAVEAAFGRAEPELVFHLAAQSLVRPSYADPLGTYATNVMGTAHVLDAARRRGGVRAVIVVTSDKCYENREQIRAYREGDAMGGHDPYSSSKGCAELVVAAYRASYFADGSTAVASARAGNVIGGGDWSAERLVPDAIRAFTAGRALELRRPEAVRPWQHVLDPLAGYLRLAELLLGPRGRDFAQAWNFGPAAGGEAPVSVVADALAAHWGEGAAWRSAGDPAGPHEAGLLALDSAKARARLGWKSAFGLDEAVARTVDWFKAYRAGADMRAFTLDQIAAHADAREAAA